MGSAGAKAMAVVLGEVDVYAHAGGQYEWDSCAPVAVALRRRAARVARRRLAARLQPARPVAARPADLPARAGRGRHRRAGRLEGLTLGPPGVAKPRSGRPMLFDGRALRHNHRQFGHGRRSARPSADRVRCQTRSVAEAPSPDLAYGAFTEQGPWVVDPDRLAWRRGLDRVRAETAREVPQLLQRRRLPPGWRVVSTAIHLGSAVALLGRQGAPVGRPASMARHLPPAAAGRRAPRADLHQARPDHLVRRGDLPRGAGRRVQKCRDQVPPEAFDVVRASSRRISGRRSTTVFSSFERSSPSRPRRSPRCTPPACRTVRTWSSRCSDPRRPARAPGPAGRWRGWRRSSSGASRSARSPTRRRSSSCSPRRSPRSSTSGSRPRTCSTSPDCFAELGQRGYVDPPAPPRRSSPGGCSVMERLEGFGFEDVAGHEGRRRRHRGRRPHRDDRRSWRAP